MRIDGATRRWWIAVAGALVAAALLTLSSSASSADLADDALPDFFDEDAGTQHYGRYFICGSRELTAEVYVGKVGESRFLETAFVSEGRRIRESTNARTLIQEPYSVQYVTDKFASMKTSSTGPSALPLDAVAIPWDTGHLSVVIEAGSAGPCETSIPLGNG